MTILSAENLFRKGLAALSEGDSAEAAALFHAAIQYERRRGGGRQQMRYLSFYGLSLSLSRGPTAEAVRACEVAARSSQSNPDLYLNLVKVYTMAGKLTRALHACEQGLRIDPRHGALRAELAKTDRRKMPALPFLRRAHPINRWLGRLRTHVLPPTFRTITMRRTGSTP